MNKEKGNKEKIMLCMSGGLDSVIAYYWLKEYAKDSEVSTIFFDYGGYTEHEKKVVLELFPDTIIDSDLKLSPVSEKDPNAYIPYRNLLFAAKAASYGADTVCLAGVKDDVVEDKSPAAFNEMSRTLSQIGRHPVSIFSPFWGKTKSEIVKWFLNESHVLDPVGILKKSISCYAPVGGKPCLSCPSCFRKWNALWDNTVLTAFLGVNLMDTYYTKAKNGDYIEQRRESIIRCVDELRGYQQICPEDEHWPIQPIQPIKPIIGRKLRYCFDIDGTLTVETEGFGKDVYFNRSPNKDGVTAVKTLFNRGAYIILHTARHQEDIHVTQDWLQKHSVPYHELIFGKPKADFYIDDCMLALEEI